LKGDIPTTIQKVANIRLQKVLKPESEKRGKKSGYSVNEKKTEFKTENRKVAE